MRAAPVSRDSVAGRAVERRRVPIAGMARHAMYDRFGVSGNMNHEPGKYRAAGMTRQLYATTKCLRVLSSPAQN